MVEFALQTLPVVMAGEEKAMEGLTLAIKCLDRKVIHTISDYN